MSDNLKQLTIKRGVLLIAFFISLQIVVGLSFYFAIELFKNTKLDVPEISSKTITLAANVCAGLLVMLWVWLDIGRKNKEFREQIGLSKPDKKLREFFVLFLIAFIATRVLVWGYRVLFLPYMGFADVQGGGTQMLTYVLDTGSYSLFAAFMALAFIIGPIVEEVLFRGYLQSALMQRFSSWSAILLTSVAFMLIHGPLILWPIYFLHSVLLGWIRARSNSVKAAILFHMLTNGYYFLIAIMGLNLLK